MSESDCKEVLDTISLKLDDIKDDIATLDKDVALNHLAYKNLNAELQEHKKDGKWKANRNIAIVAIMFTALGCWIALKGLNNNNDTYVEPTAIVKELGHGGKTNKQR